MEVVAVDRAMAQSAAPTFTEVAAFVGISDFELNENLNLPDSLTFMVPASKQDPAIASRLLDLTAAATEIWVFDDAGNQQFAGPMVGYAPGRIGDDLGWQIRAQGLLDYFKRWRIEPGTTLTYTTTDQTTIVKGLVDYWQALDYGNYGIDTTNMALTAVTRDRTYVGVEGHLIAQRITELSAVYNGFDFSIDPATRELLIHYPNLGTDRTSTIQVDGRNIIDPSAQLSVGPEDVVSDGWAIGDDGLYGTYSDATLRANLGRSAFMSKFSGVSVQQTINDHARRLQEQRSTQLHVPPKALYPVTFGWSDFGVGDLVEFAYDYGAGLMVETRRVLSRVLKVNKQGIVQIQVGLA